MTTPYDVNNPHFVDDVKAAYTFARRRTQSSQQGRPSDWTAPPEWEGQVWRAGTVVVRRAHNRWTRLIRHLCDLKADPWDYLIAAFDRNLGKTAIMVFPDQLTTPVYVAAWQNFTDSAVTSLAGVLKAQTTRLVGDILTMRRLGHKPPRDVLAALGAPASGYSPLYRYCSAAAYARERPNDRPLIESVAQLWRSAAMTQLSWSPVAYVRAWGDFIPTGLLTRTMALREGQG